MSETLLRCGRVAVTGCGLLLLLLLLFWASVIFAAAYIFT